MVGESDSETPVKPNMLIKLIIPIAALIISLLIASTVLAIIFVYEGFIELYFNVYSNNEDNPEELFSNLIKNIIFIIIFLVFIILTLKIFFKFRQKESKVSNVKEFKQEVKEPTKITIKHALIYLVLLPIFYIIFLIVGIFVVYPDRSDVDILELQNFAFYPMFILWGFMGSYVWKYKKISTAKEYFEKLNYEHIISERLIVDRIRSITILSTIGFLAIMIIFNLTYNNQNSESSFIVWIIFSISFGMFNIAMFSYVKISELEKKKRFKLFIASGFCKNCLKHDDLKVRNMTAALKWYSDFFKKLEHRGIKRIDKIVMRILASDSRNSTLEKLTDYFESDDDYAAINKIAEIMNVQVDELFEDETTAQKIKGWLIPLGALAAIGSFFTGLYILFQ